ncbi:MAG: hypothetical protein JNK21_12200 [Rhodospirillaceae bacterium]|nr:hypothetical protein [Rhodospirillaceae bacterium]
MAIMAITQFEVHSYQEGRWVLQSRFPGDERKQALADAAHIEQTTRRPTKVVKESYYPHENRSDSVTVYVSPRAKEMIAKLKKPAAGYSGAEGAARAARGLDARSGGAAGLRTTARAIAPAAADIFWRAIIAMGLSLGSAAVVTAMMSWMLTRMATFGMGLDPSAQSAVLTITYLVVFLLGVFALFRFGAPIKRLISLLWSSTTPMAAATTATTAAAMRSAGMTLKPKRKKIAFEQEQELTDMKRARGDLDAQPPVIEEVPPPPLPPPPTLVMPEPPKAKTPEVKPQTPAPAQDVPEPASLDQQAPQAKPAQPQAPQPASPEPAFSQSISELHRALAMRFATEVMLPQIARATDDPVARRGAALFLTGAMAHLAAVSGLGTVGEMGLTMTTLPATLPRHAVDAFVSQFNTHISAPANTMLMNQGRQAMARFLAGQSNDGALAQSLLAWRVPPPSALVPATAPPETLPAAPASPADPQSLPTDFYLMTELRSDDEAVMDAHNQVVREALEIADGREVKHTGHGILARFQRADEAVQAALSMAVGLAEHQILKTAGAFFGVALNAGYGAGDDPSISANATTAAQAMLKDAPPGAVIAQPVVYQHAHASQSTLQADPFTGSWLKLSLAPPPAAVHTASQGLSTVG